MIERRAGNGASFSKRVEMTNEDEAATQVVRDHFARDAAAMTLGIDLVSSGAGFASVTFVVRSDMLNAMGTVHGGFVFALADTAFAYACNSRGDSSVALQCSISFLAPARSGVRLVASARERSLGGRTGIYDVDVVDEESAKIALFRGTSYRVARIG